MNKIKCTINSLISSLASKEGDMIVLPAKEGELGVLYNHAPLVAELTAGKIRIYSDNNIEQEIEVKDGIAWITANGIEVFCS